MDDMNLKIYTPVVTGIPKTGPSTKTEGGSSSAGERQSFGNILAETINKSSEINFSKHAVKRVADHNIELSDDSINRLNEGVKLASEKKLEEPLILVGDTAFLVNVPNKTVITAVNSGKMKGNVFTNIDGTVII